jgi:hypothetical protein
MKGQEGPVPKTHEQMLKSGFDIVGTPDVVEREIHRLKEELNVEYMIFIMYGGIVEQRRMLDTIRLFGEHVIPKFPDAAARAPAAALAG